MKFFCTKYWSTKGIIEFEGDVTHDGKYAHEAGTRFDRFFLRLGKDAFTVLQSALEDVEQRAHANLHSKELALEKAKALLHKAAYREIGVVKR